MVVATSELTITYGGFSVGDAAGRPIEAWHQVIKGYIVSSVEFTFVIFGATEALFAATVSSVEDEFRIPRQNFSIIQGVTSILSLSHTANTGFDADPQITKRQDLGDTGRSRRYTVRIDFGMPADNVGTSGRRDHTINVSFDPSRRRRVTIEGTYTALAGNEARAQYDASFTAFSSAVIAAFGGIFRKLEEPTTRENATDKVIVFANTFQEVLPRIAGGLNDVTLIDQVLRIGRSDVPTGAIRGRDRRTEMDVFYSTNVDVEQTTDLEGKYSGAIRPFILAEASGLFAGGVVIEEEHPVFSLESQRIEVTMRLSGLPATRILEYTLEIEFDDLTGVQIAGVWTGNPLDHIDYDGKQTRTVIATETTKIQRGDIQSPWHRLFDPGTKGRILRTNIKRGFGGIGFGATRILTTDIIRITSAQLFNRVTGGSVGSGAGVEDYDLTPEEMNLEPEGG